MRFIKTIGIGVLLAATTQCGRAQDPDANNSPPAQTTAAAANEQAKPVEPSRPTKAVAAMRVPIDGLPAIGSERALVTIVEFTDYQCPYCARAEERMTALRQTYGDDVRLVFAAHPLPMHDRARPAALAALAAAQQGRFAAMHARLFAEGNALDDAGLARAAAEAGLDLVAFDSARAAPETAAALERAEALGRTGGVTGTPTFFVNGRRVVGAQQLATFKAIVDEELANARALLARGTRRDEVYAKLQERAAPLAPESSPKGEACADKDGDCQGAPPSRQQPTERALDVRVDSAPLRGFARAAVTVAVFADFECPYSARAEKTMRELEQAYEGKVRVAWKSRPLPMHAHARLASKAALAAHAQGKFWEYHDVLFAHQGALDRASLERYARDLGLAEARFQRDLDSPELDARVAADDVEASALGVDGTPTIFVNGMRIVGAQPLAAFKTAVDRALGTTD